MVSSYLFLGLFHSLGDLARSLNNFSLKVFLSKDSPPLGMSGCSEKHKLGGVTSKTVLELSSFQAVFETPPGHERPPSLAANTGLNLWNAATTLWRGAGPLEQCLGLSDSSPQFEDCPTPARGFCHSTEDICFESCLYYGSISYSHF